MKLDPKGLEAANPSDEARRLREALQLLVQATDDMAFATNCGSADDALTQARAALEATPPTDGKAATAEPGEGEDEPHWNTLANELLMEFCACYGEAWPTNTCHTERRRLVPWLKECFKHHAPPSAQPSKELVAIARKLRTYAEIYTGDKEARKMADWCESAALSQPPETIKQGFDVCEDCPPRGLKGQNRCKGCPGAEQPPETDAVAAERERLADVLKAYGTKLKPGAARLHVAVAADIVRRGRELSATEQVRNLKRFLDEPDDDARSDAATGGE